MCEPIISIRGLLNAALAVAFAFLTPLYKRRFGWIMAGLIALALMAAEYVLFARVVGPIWQGPAFEGWQLPLVAVALIGIASGVGVALTDKVLGVERPNAI